MIKEGYKKTDYGSIPIEWDFVKLNTIFKRITTKNKECNKNVLTISAQKGLINQEKFFNKIVASKDNSNYYLLEKDDFAYNKSYSAGYPMGAIKKLEYYDKGIVSPLYVCFRLVDENSDKEFYKYYFEHNIFEKAISSIAQEGARNHGLLNVSISEFFDLAIFKPPLKEQQKIAKILSSVDAQIDGTDKLIEKFKELKKGLIQRLLTRGIGHKEFKHTEIGEIPVEWKVRKLGEVGKIIMGQSPDGDSYNNEGLGIPLLNGPTEFTEKHPIPKQWTIKPTKTCKENDILFCVRGSSVGRMNISNDKYCIGRGLAAIHGKAGETTTTYLYYVLQKFINDILNLSVGSTFPNVGKDDLNGLLCTIPPLNEQEEIVNILSSLDIQIEEYENKKNKLYELKKGLMQQLLIGKIRVK